MKRIILIGSGRTAEYAKNMSRREEDVLIALNNAWQTRADFDYLLFANDFPRDKLPRHYSGELVDSMDIEPTIAAKYGPLMFRGSTMAFNGIYFALSQLPDEIITIGCDMDYRVIGGRTHFYGIGGKDPLRYNISLRSLKAKSRRVLSFAVKQNVTLTRVYDDPVGELSLPRINFADYEKQKIPPPVQSNEKFVSEALKAENNVPFNAKIRKYWKYNDDELVKRHVKIIDELWHESASF